MTLTIGDPSDPRDLATLIAVLQRELDATPQDPLLHYAMAEAKAAQGDELAEAAHLAAAQILEAYADPAQLSPPIDLCNIATGYFMKGDHRTAERWYRLVLMLDPHFAIAYLNLTAIYSSAGRSRDAEVCRQRAYRIQRLFVEHDGDPLRRVLILLVGRSAGNVPIEVLLPTRTCSRIKYVIDYASEAEDAQLPPFDLVFNAIGDPDTAAPLLPRLQRFARSCQRPVLNAPEAVARTQRQRVPALLQDLDQVATAPCLRLEAAPRSRDELRHLLTQSGLEFPLLLRPEATHGGEGLVCCETLDSLEDGLRDAAQGQYLTNFCDYRSADGLYRKYRIVFVDRQPYPYHLAIASQWMVHYHRAAMEVSPWKIDEERRFLQDPGAALGCRALDAVAAIGQRLDLDYCGIDFTLLADGRVFVFEANATMLVHGERVNGPLVHKNTYVQGIADAFELLLARRCTDLGGR